MLPFGTQRLRRYGLLKASAAAPAAPAGPINYVTNGTFTGNDATGWSLSTVGTISGEKLFINNTSGSTKTISYTFPVAPPNGTVCTVSFLVGDFVANGGGINQGITVCGGSSAAGPLITGNGTYTVTATASSGTTLTITARNGMNLSIDVVKTEA